MLYEYCCKKCGHEQERLVKMNEEPKDPCDKCKAPVKYLKRILSAHATMKFSWSKWNV